MNFNGWKDTVECLESLLRTHYPDYRIIVCDNGSTDDSLERIREWASTGTGIQPASHEVVNHLTSPPVDKPIRCRTYERSEAEAGGVPGDDPRLVLIDCGANLGFGAGNNVGLRYAQARDDFSYAWLLNNDTVVTRDALSNLVSRMKDTPSAGMCGSTLLHYDNPERVQALGGGYYCKWIGLPWHMGQFKTTRHKYSQQGTERWMNYVIGASLLVSKEFLQKTGLMEEEYFLYFEELDWALRGKPFFGLAYAPESIVYHKVGRSIGTSSDPRQKSEICDYFNIRNRIFFTRKFFPEAIVPVYATLLFAVLVRLFFCKWKRALMIGRLMAAAGRHLHEFDIRRQKILSYPEKIGFRL